MRSWTITQARANIANLFDAALKSGPQKIERRDSEPVVLIAEADWRRLASEYPAMADLILNCPVGAEALPPRRPARVLAGGFE